MTQPELKAADLVLSKLIPNDPCVWTDALFKHWLFENNANNQFSSLLEDKTDSTYNNVHGYLLREGFMGRTHSGQEEKYLTPKGIKARELKGIQKYLVWERRNKGIDKIKEVAFWITFVSAVVSASYAIISYHFTTITKTEFESKSDSLKLQSLSTTTHSKKSKDSSNIQSFIDSTSNNKSDKNKPGRTDSLALKQ